MTFGRAYEGGQCIDQGEAFGLKSLHEEDDLRGHQFTWFDTGTPGTLEHVRKAFRQSLNQIFLRSRMKQFGLLESCH